MLTKEECQTLIRWHNSHRHLEQVGSEKDYWGIRKLHIKNEYIRLLFQKVQNHCIGEIYKATGQVFHSEMATITKWHIGGEQTPHLDTFSNDEVREDPSIETQVESGDRPPSREWTVIVYLNDDYNGGETYFPPTDYYPMGYQVEPTVGSGLLFQGIYHGHGVFKVRRAPRHTMAIWFTADLEKCMTERPVDDLNHNEITIREHLDFGVADSLYNVEDLSKDPERWIQYKQFSKHNS